jgi:hypothetical protein
VNKCTWTRFWKKIQKNLHEGVDTLPILCIIRASQGENDMFDEDYNDDDSWIIDDDGQPDEYTEWQDLYGGDDWDHGQFDGGEW